MAPESTRAAIRAAARAGADMIELDVQMTRDGRLVVFHDRRLERTTDGSGVVTKQRYAQLATLDAGRWVHPRFAGERILLLSRALQLIPRRMQANLELKSTPARAVVLRRLARVLRRSGGSRRRFLLSSFDPRLLARLRASRFTRALISSTDPARALRAAIRLGCHAWHPSFASVTPRWVAQAHAAGLRIHVWTVDDVRRARRLAHWGVDGIFTNDPARVRKGLERR